MSEGTLGPADEELVRVAALQRERAYAPYSRYKVGAAARSKRDRIHTGANVENASPGLSVCAERCAVSAAVNAGDRDLESIAVVTGGDVVPALCGACRQVLQEFGPAMRVILATTTGRRRVTTLSELLPDAFGPDRLPPAS